MAARPPDPPPAQGAVRVSVVVAARDAQRTLPAALDALAAQDLGEPFEVVVVDNGSCDATARLAQAHPRVDRLVRRPRGAGPGAARNAGVRAAAGETIAFTDADCVPAPGWLREGLAASSDLVQGTVVPARRPGPFDRSLSVTSEYGLYETANLFVRRGWFDRAGGFEDVVRTDDGRPFGEDVVFAWTVRRLGGRTAFSPGAVVRHAVSPGTPRSYVRERSREVHFATLARLVPELREHFFYRRYFLNRRSAALAAALLLRRPAGLVPWLWLVGREASRLHGGPSPRVALVVAVGDVTSFIGRLRASLAGDGPLL